MDVYKISLLSSIAANLLALSVGWFYCYRKDAPSYLRVFPWYLLVSFGVEAFAGVSQHFKYILYNLFTLFEFFTFAWFFGKVVHSKITRWFLGFCTIGFTIFFIFYSWGRGIGKAPNVVAIVLEVFIIIIPCLKWYHELFTRDEPIDLFKEPSYWLINGIVVYLAASLPFYVASIYFTINGLFKAADSLLAINNFALIITYLLFIKGFACRVNAHGVISNGEI